MPGRHTAKQKRQAKHIISSERARGVDSETAKRIGWATVNKQKVSKGPAAFIKPLGDRIAAPKANAASAPSSPTPKKPIGLDIGPVTVDPVKTKPIDLEVGKVQVTPAAQKPIGLDIGPVTVQPAKTPAVQKPPKPPMVATKALDPSEAHFREESRKLAARAGRSKKRPFGRKGMMHAFGKGGEVALPRPKTPWATPRENMSRMSYGSRKKHKGGFIARHKMGVKDLGTVTVSAKTEKGNMGKSLLQVMSIADYHNALVKADAPPGGAPAPTTPPKRFPRKEKPTVKMKPISDQEAMANLKAGKYHEKSLRMLMAIKALATGYSKTGGGALRAANRGNLTLEDLQRAMEAMPKPSSVKPPSTYLPGVHDPKSPMRNRKGKAAPKPGGGAGAMASLKHDLAAKCMDAGNDASSMEPDLKKQKTTKSLAESMVDDGWQPVVHKSEGDPSMSKTNFNDLFKSELGIANDDVLVDCPHCEAPITKSDLAKASLASKPGPGAMRGGDGRGQVKSSRGVPGAKKHDEPSGIQNNKGSKTRKSDDVENDVEKGDEGQQLQTQVPAPKQPEVKKSIVGVRGTDFVQYIDYGDAPGGDAYIAKSIAEAQGALGQQATQPMDLNNDLSRLLV